MFFVILSNLKLTFNAELQFTPCQSVRICENIGFALRWFDKRSSSRRHQRIRPGSRDHELLWVCFLEKPIWPVCYSVLQLYPLTFSYYISCS